MINKEYQEIIEEFRSRIRKSRKSYDEKLLMREEASFISTLLEDFNKKQYPDIHFDSRDYEILKRVLLNNNSNITDDYIVTVLESFRAMNYYNTAEKELLSRLMVTSYYTRTNEVINSFLEDYSNYFNFFVQKKWVSKNELLEDASYIEKLLESLSFLGQEGFTEIMDDDKITKVFNGIDILQLDEDIANKYKTIILYKALQQDKALRNDKELYKVYVKGKDNPINVLPSTIEIEEEELEDTKIINEKIILEEDETFDNDDLIDLLDLKIEDEEDKKKFFDSFDLIINDRDRMDRMFTIIRDFCNDQIRELEQMNLGYNLDNYDDRSKVLSEYFKGNESILFGDKFIYYKNALLMMQDLEDLSKGKDLTTNTLANTIDISSEDKYTLLTLFGSLYMIERLERNKENEMVYEDEEIETLEDETLEDETVDLDSLNNKKLYILDPDIFSDLVDSSNMDLKDRKKIASIINGLLEGEKTKVGHPYAGFMDNSSAVLKEYGVWVTKKGGKTRMYYAPIKNSNNEEIADIIVLPYVTSKDRKHITNEQVDSANILVKNKDRFMKLKESIIHNIDSPLLEEENNRTRELLKNLNDKISKNKVSGGAVR